jgi:CRP-like cAMP-binding protein
MIDKINTLTWLRSIDTFRDVPEAQLEWLYDHSEWERQPADSYLYHSGDRIKGTYIIKSGQFRLVVTTGVGSGEVDTFGPNDITGYLPFSRGNVFVGSGEVLANLEYLFFSVEHQGELISTQYELTQARCM